MSKVAEVNSYSRKRRPTLVIIILLALLLLAYGGGVILLPVSILSSYAKKNCQSTLTLDGFYTRIYPVFMQDESLTEPVMECALYTLAIQNEEQNKWRDSYNDFTVYMEAYPAGLFTMEAHEHIATLLVGMAKEEIGQKKYPEALVNLNLILKDYGDTNAANDAETLMTELYLAWGIDLRDTSDFLGSEQVFNEFLRLSQKVDRTENIKTAQKELALTYLTWGLKLQEQKQYEGAMAKFDLVLSIDPEPASSSGPAAQVKAGQSTFYIAWGDALVEQKDYARAIEQYNTAVSLSESDNQTVGLDAVANGYIQWAVGLSNEESFLEALKKIDLSQENASTDVMKKAVEDARTETYLSFSKSTGEQAKQAMQDALRKVCELGEKPDLPIFGLDEKHIFVGVYGVTLKLPENIAVTTPGQLHYIACIDVTEKTIQYVDFYGYKMMRVKIFWDIELHDVKTGAIVATKQLEGGNPPPLPTEPGAIVAAGQSQKYVGDPPSVNDLVEWLMSEIK